MTKARAIDVEKKNGGIQDRSCKVHYKGQVTSYKLQAASYKAQGAKK
jgi:hypothetical protein